MTDVRKLRLILQHSRDWCQDGVNERNPKVRLDAYRWLLRALIELFEEDEEIKREALTYPLLRLFEDLNEIDQGRTPDTLKTRKKPGKKQKSSTEDQLAGAAAGIAEAEKKGGLSLQEAATKVAGYLNKIGYRLSGKTISATTIKKWREKCMDNHNSPPSNFMLRMYKLTSEEILENPEFVLDNAYNLLDQLTKELLSRST